MYHSRHNIYAWAASLLLAAALIALAACTEGIAVDFKIDESRIRADVPDSLTVTVGHTEELYIPVPTYDGRKINEADIRIEISSRDERTVTVHKVNDSTFTVKGEAIGSTLVDIRYGSWTKAVTVTVVDEMVTALILSADSADLFAGEEMEVTYSVEPPHLLHHKVTIGIPGLEDNAFVYNAYSDTPGHIRILAVRPGETVLTVGVDTCKALIRCLSREVLPQSVSGEHVGGSWKLSEGQADSSQFYVLPDNTTYPELGLVLTAWEPDDIYDIPVTDASGRSVGTIKSNYAAQRDSVGDPVLTVGGAPVPYRDSAGRVITYGNAQVSARCVYTPKVEDYLIFEGERLNNFKMTGLKACHATFSAPVKAHPEVTCSFEVKVSGEKRRYE